LLQIAVSSRKVSFQENATVLSAGRPVLSFKITDQPAKAVEGAISRHQPTYPQDVNASTAVWGSKSGEGNSTFLLKFNDISENCGSTDNEVCALTCQKRSLPQPSTSPTRHPKAKPADKTVRQTYEAVQDWPGERRKEVKVGIRKTVEGGEDGKKKKTKTWERLDFDLWTGIVVVAGENG
jgi:hypothetical protein